MDWQKDQQHELRIKCEHLNNQNPCLYSPESMIQCMKQEKQNVENNHVFHSKSVVQKDTLHNRRSTCDKSNNSLLMVVPNVANNVGKHCITATVSQINFNR